MLRGLGGILLKAYFSPFLALLPSPLSKLIIEIEPASQAKNTSTPPSPSFARSTAPASEPGASEGIAQSESRCDRYHALHWGQELCFFHILSISPLTLSPPRSAFYPQGPQPSPASNCIDTGLGTVVFHPARPSAFSACFTTGAESPLEPE